MGRLGSKKGVKSSPLLYPPFERLFSATTQPFKFVKACYAFALQSIAKNYILVCRFRYA